MVVLPAGVASVEDFFLCVLVVFEVVWAFPVPAGVFAALVVVEREDAGVDGGVGHFSRHRAAEFGGGAVGGGFGFDACAGAWAADCDHRVSPWGWGLSLPVCGSGSLRVQSGRAAAPGVEPGTGFPAWKLGRTPALLRRVGQEHVDDPGGIHEPSLAVVGIEVEQALQIVGHVVGVARLVSFLVVREEGVLDAIVDRDGAVAIPLLPLLDGVVRLGVLLDHRLGGVVRVVREAPASAARGAKDRDSSHCVSPGVGGCAGRSRVSSARLWQPRAPR